MTEVQRRHHRLTLLAAIALAAALLPAVAAASPQGKEDRLANNVENNEYSESFGVHVLGHADPGQGFNADVVAHGRYAFMGSWGNAAGNFETDADGNVVVDDQGDPVLSGEAPYCPNQGVQVFDLEDPRNPQHIATFADAADGHGLEGSWTEKVIVADVDTPAFTGTLAAVSAQICNLQEDVHALGGFALYDVTDPTNPQLLATVESEMDEEDPDPLEHAGHGSHEIWLEARGDAAYVYTAEILQEEMFGVPDLRIFDVSDPTEPEWIGDWGVLQDEGIQPVSPDEDDVMRVRFVHSVIVSDEVAYVSYWDRGTVLLDVSDPSEPEMIAAVDIPTEGLWSRGSMHSSWLAHGGDLLIETNEVFNPFPAEESNQEFAWGFPRFTDISDPAEPVVVGGFEMDTTRMEPDELPFGDWTVHDPKVRPGLPGEEGHVYFSWYSEGVAVVDIDAAIEASDIEAGETASEEDALVAQFVPPPAEDPRAFFGPEGVAFPFVWGVFLHEHPETGERFALASDINSGLWVFQLEEEAVAFVQRLSGADRIATAIEVSQDQFGDGEAGAVVLARSTAFPDALAGTPLAIYEDAPLLLTPATALDARVETEIQRVLDAGGTVYLLGGESALQPGVEASLDAMGYDTVRLAGPSRFETAVAIAEQIAELVDLQTLLVATGADFADALAGGAASAQVNGAILLTAGASMHPATQAFIDEHGALPRYALGGPASSADPAATAIAGATRFETAVEVAEQFFDEPTVAGLATGLEFPDALTGGAHVGREGGPILLTLTASLHAAPQGYLEAHAATIAAAHLYGGPGVLTADVHSAVAAAIGAQ